MEVPHFGRTRDQAHCFQIPVVARLAFVFPRSRLARAENRPSATGVPTFDPAHSGRGLWFSRNHSRIFGVQASLKFVRFYNVDKLPDQQVFANQSQAFVVFCWIGIAKGREPAAVLSDAWSLFGLKCWAFERLASGMECGMGHVVDTKAEIVSEMRQAFQICWLILADNPRWSSRLLKARRCLWGPDRPWTSRFAIVHCGKSEFPAFDDIAWYSLPASGMPGLWYDPAKLYGEAYNKVPTSETKPEETQAEAEGGSPWDIEEPEEREPVVSTVRLTNSQREIYEQLEAFYNLKAHGFRVAGIDPRPIPLIVAPSGTGKTYLVHRFAADFSLPVLALDAGSWVVSGAAHRPFTEDIIKEFGKRYNTGLILIDELDKFGASCDWSKHMQQEVFALLDGFKRGFNCLDDNMRRHLADDFLIVGAGTWQDLHQGSGMGFKTEEVNVGREIFRNGGIPFELLARFNPNLLFLAPPTFDEFREWVADIHKSLAIDPPQDVDLLAQAAVDSRMGARWLEGYTSMILIQYKPWVENSLAALF
jgi:hypothetical protein